MRHTTDTPPLSSIQQCVVDALAAGSTLSNAAETYGIHRVTIYRWMKTSKPFIAALHLARAEFVLARRDDLHQLSKRALETLLAILDNPKSSPAVLLRTSMFILQRPQLPKTGWCMPEPSPDPDDEKLMDSAIIEKDYDSLPGLYHIERDPDPYDPPPTHAESATSEPPPAPESPFPPEPDVTPRNTMQHDPENGDDVAPDPPEVPEVPEVPEAPDDHEDYLKILHMFKTTPQGKPQRPPHRS